MLSGITKIGEGVFGEVFKGIQRDGTMTVFKIMPIEGEILVNDEPQKNFVTICPEIFITNALSNLRLEGRKFRCPNFVHLQKCCCVRGRYPDRLLAAWDIFYESGMSENDRPDIFPDDQLFVILCLEDGGESLDRFIFSFPEQSLSVFYQVSLALAAAELSFQFEHRDLHIGNILVKPTNLENLTYQLGNSTAKVKTYGVRVFIIDFTLSSLNDKEIAVYADFSEDMFTGEGDLQFDVYRDMKMLVELAHQEASYDGDDESPWRLNVLKTNLLWLHYLSTKLRTVKKYPKKLPRKQAKVLENYETVLDDLIKYNSVTEFVNDQLQFLFV